MAESSPQPQSPEKPQETNLTKQRHDQLYYFVWSDEHICPSEHYTSRPRYYQYAIDSRDMRYQSYWYPRMSMSLSSSSDPAQRQEINVNELCYCSSWPQARSLFPYLHDEAVYNFAEDCWRKYLGIYYSLREINTMAIEPHPWNQDLEGIVEAGKRGRQLVGGFTGWPYKMFAPWARRHSPNLISQVRETMKQAEENMERVLKMARRKEEKVGREVMTRRDRWGRAIPQAPVNGARMVEETGEELYFRHYAEKAARSYKSIAILIMRCRTAFESASPAERQLWQLPK